MALVGQQSMAMSCALHVAVAYSPGLTCNLADCTSTTGPVLVHWPFIHQAATVPTGRYAARPYSLHAGSMLS